MPNEQSAITKSELRWYQYSLRTLLLVITVSALVMGLSKWYFSEPPPIYYTLPELLALGNFQGYDLVQGPDRPGPYEYIGGHHSGNGNPASGVFRGHGKSREYHIPGVPNEELLVAGLVPKDGGEPTYMVLKLRKAD